MEKIKLTEEQIAIFKPLSERIDREKLIFKEAKEAYYMAHKKLWDEIKKILPQTSGKKEIILNIEDWEIKEKE